MVWNSQKLLFSEIPKVHKSCRIVTHLLESENAIHYALAKL